MMSSLSGQCQGQLPCLPQLPQQNRGYLCEKSPFPSYVCVGKRQPTAMTGTEVNRCSQLKTDLVENQTNGPFSI